MRRTLIVADTHLTRHTPVAVSRDLAALVASHPGARLIVAGDLFDRSAEPRPAPSVDEVLRAHGALRKALGEHLGRGGELWLVAGNHDAEVADGDFQGTLLSALELPGEARARLRTTPWLLREGGLHVEHGHLYDPDNAPAHPLVRGVPSLGVRFVHDFIAPTGAYAYLNRNDKLPLELFVEAFTRYGSRGPFVVATFFRAAFAALRTSGPFFQGKLERARGEAELAAFAELAGVDPKTLRGLCGSAPDPTLTSFRATFSRLYLDRVAATMALLAGGGLVFSGRRRAALAAFVLGAVAMLASWSRDYDRYGGLVPPRLAEGARLVAEVTGARAVVFGHAHKPEVSGVYSNPGSFAFPVGPERTYLEIEGTVDAPVPTLRRARQEY